MTVAATAFAKLAGIVGAIRRLLADTATDVFAKRPLMHFQDKSVQQYFNGAAMQLQVLQRELPALYEDFPPILAVPEQLGGAGTEQQSYYSRTQLEALARTIDQMHEIRSNSELASPSKAPSEHRVFISHGRAEDWREVQAYIERDMGIKTLELAQEANRGRTVMQKLEEESSRCTAAVIVMTGDDTDSEGNSRARENVIHEIGYFQGKFGFAGVCVLHEEGTSLPSNIHGLVYAPFSRGQVRSTFSVLSRDLNAFFRK